MQFEKGDKFLAIVLLCIVFLVGVLGGTLLMNHKYKQGQVDALTGNAKYELIEHEDNTRTWEWIING